MRKECFLGLDRMAPIPTLPGMYAFEIESGLVERPDPIGLARALRRAVMARVQVVLGETAVLPPFFTGHEPEGEPARSERHPHLFFLFMPGASRLIVLAPHLVEQRAPHESERKHLQTLAEALAGFCELRAGSGGRLRLRPVAIDVETDPLFAAARVWESVTPYVVTRHWKLGEAAAALCADLVAECGRRGLPRPVVTPGERRGVPGVGLRGYARLVFPAPVRGPLLLGRQRYLGGGLFVARAGDAHASAFRPLRQRDPLRGRRAEACGPEA